MRKNVFGRKLQRDINERKALFKSLMRELILNERINTTEAKAKSIKANIEKIVTKAIKNPDLAKQKLQAYFDMHTVRKLVEEIAPRFSKIPGGYTRIIRAGKRLRDNAKMVIIEWTKRDEKLSVENKIETNDDIINKTEIINAEIVSETKSETKKKIVKPSVKKEDKINDKKDKSKTKIKNKD